MVFILGVVQNQDCAFQSSLESLEMHKNYIKAILLKTTWTLQKVWPKFGLKNGEILEIKNTIRLIELYSSFFKWPLGLDQEKNVQPYKRV